MTTFSVASDIDSYKYFGSNITNAEYDSNIDKSLWNINFLQNTVYLMKNTSTNDDNVDTIQWKIAGDNFNKVMKGNVSKYSSNIINYAAIPEQLLSTAYIPFYQNLEDTTASSVNFNLLTLDDKIPDDYMNATYHQFPLKTDTEYIKKKIDFKDKLRDLLQSQIKNLNDPDKTYNNFKLTNMIAFVCLLWGVIVITSLRIINYYYSEYYSIIIIVMTIMLLVSTVIWKMSIILRS